MSRTQRLSLDNHDRTSFNYGTSECSKEVNKSNVLHIHTITHVHGKLIKLIRRELMRDDQSDRVRRRHDRESISNFSLATTFIMQTKIASIKYAKAW